MEKCSGTFSKEMMGKLQIKVLKKFQKLKKKKKTQNYKVLFKTLWESCTKMLGKWGKKLKLNWKEIFESCKKILEIMKLKKNWREFYG